MSKELTYRMRLTGSDMHDRIWIPMSPIELKHIANLYALMAMSQKENADLFNGLADKMNKAYGFWCEKKGKCLEEHKVPDYEGEGWDDE